MPIWTGVSTPGRQVLSGSLSTANYVYLSLTNPGDIRWRKAGTFAIEYSPGPDQVVQWKALPIWYGGVAIFPFEYVSPLAIVTGKHN